MAKHPKKPFTLAANPEQELENIRDKDNGDPKPPPPRIVKFPRRNLAPSGMQGIKRGLPSPASQKATKEPPKAGDLTKSFTPLVQRQKGIERDIDR